MGERVGQCLAAAALARHAARRKRTARINEALAQVGLSEFASCLSARTVRRHEDARFAGAGAGHRSGYPVDGRAVRRTRRDHALSAEQRSAGAVAQAAQDGRLRDPFGVRVGLSVAARGGDVAASRARQRRISHRHAGAARRGVPDVGRYVAHCREVSQALVPSYVGAEQAHEFFTGFCSLFATRRWCSPPASRSGIWSCG